jgi:hypothetical protein
MRLFSNPVKSRPAISSRCPRLRLRTPHAGLAGIMMAASPVSCAVAATHFA